MVPAMIRVPHRERAGRQRYYHLWASGLYAHSPGAVVGSLHEITLAILDL